MAIIEPTPLVQAVEKGMLAAFKRVGASYRQRVTVRAEDYVAVYDHCVHKEELMNHPEVKAWREKVDYDERRRSGNLEALGRAVVEAMVGEELDVHTAGCLMNGLEYEARIRHEHLKTMHCAVDEMGAGVGGETRRGRDGESEPEFLFWSGRIGPFETGGPTSPEALPEDGPPSSPSATAV